MITLRREISKNHRLSKIFDTFILIFYDFFGYGFLIISL